jgi:hypothetical protein
MENDVKKLQIDMKEIQTQMKFVREEIKEVKDIMNDFIEKVDDKYASKWTEKAWWWMITSIGFLLLGYVSKVLTMHQV